MGVEASQSELILDFLRRKLEELAEQRSMTQPPPNRKKQAVKVTDSGEKEKDKSA